MPSLAAYSAVQSSYCEADAPLPVSLSIVLCCLQRMLNLSEEQKADMLHLRRLYITRRCLHAMERQALLTQAAVSRDQMPMPSDNLTQTSDLAAALQKNAADDYRVYHRTACAGRRGVSSSQPLAHLTHTGTDSSTV